MKPKKREHPESCAERILRMVMHERDLGCETPAEVYDETMAAVMEIKKPNYGDIRRAKAILKIKEQRFAEIRAKRGPRAAEFAHRMDMECGVLEWAIDAMVEIVENRRAHAQRKAARA